MALQSTSTEPPVVLVLVTVDEPPAPLAPVELIEPPVLPPPVPDTLLVVEFAPNPPGPNPPGPVLLVVAVPVVELVTPWLPAVEPVVAVELFAVELAELVAAELVDVVAVLAVVPVGPCPNPPVTVVWLAVVSSAPGGDSPAGSEHPALSRIQGSECNLRKCTRWRPSGERERWDGRRARTGRKDRIFTAPSVFPTEPSVGCENAKSNMIGDSEAFQCGSCLGLPCRTRARSPCS